MSKWHGGGAAAPIAVPHAPGAAGPAAEGEGDAPAPEPAVVPCEVCAAGAAKYKCPRCVVQTCSLACVRRHKAEQECSGVRNKAEHRSLTDFTDNDMRSDFHFLTTSSAWRTRPTARRVQGQAHAAPAAPNHLKNLVRQASFRAVALQSMPATLQRRKDNTTFFNHKTKDMLCIGSSHRARLPRGQRRSRGAGQGVREDAAQAGGSVAAPPLARQGHARAVPACSAPPADSPRQTACVRAVAGLQVLGKLIDPELGECETAAAASRHQPSRLRAPRSPHPRGALAGGRCVRKARCMPEHA